MVPLLPNHENQKGGNDDGYKKVNVGSFGHFIDLGLGSWGYHSGGGRDTVKDHVNSPLPGSC